MCFSFIIKTMGILYVLDFFEAIARYIEVVRRLGKLEHAEVCLKKAESVSCNLNIDPGYYYCKGLYEWYFILYK